eukprot:SAG31_NODE_530_length_14420_cov_4.259968_13_plen_252_part_00
MPAAVLPVVLAAVRFAQSMIYLPAGSGYQSPRVRLPPWPPSYRMADSTILMACNYSDYVDTRLASKFGLVSFDWSDAKQLWCNEQPMRASRRLYAQAQMLAAAAGSNRSHSSTSATRIGMYRNSIKALNWFEEVRDKLDDPEYFGWFLLYNGTFLARQSNRSYPAEPTSTQQKAGIIRHDPACDPASYGNQTKCSRFWHDQDQTPNMAGMGVDYVNSGTCERRCDCGRNPCGECACAHDRCAAACATARRI